MNFEPQKFFIGLIDFFSIIMPGALLAYVLKNDDEVSAWLALSGQGSPTGAEGWIVFLFVSYLIGHFVFLLGSWLDEIYDVLRRDTLNRQIDLLARHGRLIHPVRRLIAWLLFKRERNLAVSCTGRIKRARLDPLGGGAAVNTFQWSKARLTVEKPEALAAVHRFEADSKFFRSFAVVLLILIVVFGWRERWGASAACIVPLLIALWRFMEQRYKATNQAYWQVITLEGQNGATQSAFSTPRNETDATHAGGAVFRTGPEGLEYLLVEATYDQPEWVLPKGQTEVSETLRQTAVRGVHEETGVWARIVRDLGIVRSQRDGRHERVHYFLMEFLAQGWPSDRDREIKWLPLAKAIAALSPEKSRQLLWRAEKKRVKTPQPGARADKR